MAILTNKTTNSGTNTDRVGFVIGKKSDENHFYAKKVGHSYVFTVKTGAIAEFPKSKADLRETKLVLLQRNDIRRIEVERDHQKITFQKDKDIWVKTKDKEKTKNPPMIESLITELVTLRAESFLDDLKEKPLDSKVLSFDSPSLKINVLSDREKVKLLFGRSNDDGMVTVKLPDKGIVVTVKREVFERISRKL